MMAAALVVQPIAVLVAVIALLDPLSWNISPACNSNTVWSGSNNRTYAKPPQLRCWLLAVLKYCLRRYALMGQFCVSPK